MIKVSAGLILAAFRPVPTAIGMPVGVLRRKHDYKKKKKKLRKWKNLCYLPWVNREKLLINTRFNEVCKSSSIIQ